jgi:preprotein translocase subunit SecE
MRLTLMVISIALAAGLFLGLIDLLFTRLFGVLLTAG